MCDPYVPRQTGLGPLCCHLRGRLYRLCPPAYEPSGEHADCCAACMSKMGVGLGAEGCGARREGFNPHNASSGDIEMVTRRGVLTLIATAVLSLVLLIVPQYASGPERATLLQVNGSAGLIVILPIAVSLLPLFSSRLRLFAGFLMLCWVILGAWTVGLFYAPIAVCLLWPSTSRQADSAMPTLR